MPKTKDGGWLLDDTEIEPPTKEELEKESEKEAEAKKPPARLSK